MLCLCPRVWHFDHQNNSEEAFHQRRSGISAPSWCGRQNFAWICNRGPTSWWSCLKNNSSKSLLGGKGWALGLAQSELLLLCAFHCWIKMEIHWILPDSDLSIISARDDFWGISIKKHIVDLSLVTNKFEWSNLRFKVPDLDETISSSWYHLLPTWIQTYISLEKPTLATDF